jgi:hypothetical protein
MTLEQYLRKLMDRRANGQGTDDLLHTCTGCGVRGIATETILRPDYSARTGLCLSCHHIAHVEAIRESQERIRWMWENNLPRPGVGTWLYHQERDDYTDYCDGVATTSYGHPMSPPTGGH